jgi:predicted DNA-binding ribbon-helix-helix protein
MTMPATEPREAQPDKPIVIPTAEDSTTRFVAVRSGEFRRGLRLEEIYWRALKDVATAWGLSIGGLVRQVEEAAGEEEGNATSRLRVLCLGWFMDRLAKVQALTHRGMTNSLIQACPTPAFALAVDRQIIAYNPHFLNLIQSRLSIVGAGSMARNLRLALDVQIHDLITHLQGNNNMPVGTGFVIGVDSQRFRGRMNAVLVPSLDAPVIACYVLPD